MRGVISTIEGILFVIGGLALVLGIIIYVLGEYGYLGFITPITLERLISGMVSGAVVAFFTGLIFLILRDET